MGQVYCRTVSILVVFSFLVTLCSTLGAQTPSSQPGIGSDSSGTADVLRKLDELVEQNQQLQNQNQQLMTQINAMRQALAKQDMSAPSGNTTQLQQSSITAKPAQEDSSVQSTSLTSENEEQKKWGSYTPNQGYKLVNTEYGDVNLSIYTYVRYLNQLGLDSNYTDAFGNIKKVQQRQDLQIQKVQIKFLGWLLDPKLRYFLYAWTSNASQGLGAQVVLAGNLNYTFNKHFSFAGGITSLPGTRSVEGNFPFWLAVDTRLIADEFFRPSYTSGIWAKGEIVKGLSYQAMLGNNLSTLGVSAAQLNNKFNTLATALVWTPTGQFGQGFGDFEDQQQVATRFAGHFTRSNEDRQEQPNSDQFENTQIRLEDGTVIFTPNTFGQGVEVTDVRYRMTAFDAGFKYRGYSLDGEYFLRWLDNFKGPGTAGLPSIFSQGYQLQASAMVVPKTLQLYMGGSTLYGKYGHPWDFRSGVNVFPWHNKVIRWNTEFLYLYKSPVGYTSVPFALGGTGPVFHTNVEMAF
jgi:hypothetical protein